MLLDEVNFKSEELECKKRELYECEKLMREFRVDVETAQCENIKLKDNFSTLEKEISTNKKTKDTLKN